MLSATEHRAVVRALRAWAQSAPDEPALGFVASKSTMTAGELLEEVLDRTADGQAFLELIEHGLRVDGMESVLGRFTKAVEVRSRQLVE